MDSIESALEDLVSGKMIVVMDDEDRENEGDLICSAELCTPEMVNFMSTQGKGLICVSITPERANELNLEVMVKDNSALHETKFTVSVDYVHNTSTGISAVDRAHTIRALANKETKPSDLGRPGHIFPLIAQSGGVLRRAGHTEATVDLMRLAGLKPVGVLCEVINEDGTMARKADLIKFAEKFDLKIITVKDLIAYRFQKDTLVKEVAVAKIPSEYGDFKMHVYENIVDGKEHIALVKGEWNQDEAILVRVHSECLTGDVFGSFRCDCGPQLEQALKNIEEAGKGVLLYMRQEGRGIGLINKIKAYALQEEGMDTVEANEHLGFKADARDYGVGAQILHSLGVRKMILMTNNPKKRVGINSYGLEVVDTQSIEIQANKHNESYLKTKKDKMGHLLKNM
ncbi:MAG: bifunctional 3,4-dihydroxy-2-butanone-4-phosphate synthase/GTP cyclohydrolase II [Candidatus Kapaibacterium sp.]|nr:bifunctional 3,4-dihydroxy-2-butanone-4-phosphate synthase/GTP cyclohydrolase II [Ignavibacteriota bacterium]MCB9220695.1 bifunctional 3,4-dihydroxy-2-butanone-4-phosphate synthase/GTP cyclohydrolase II [Ignavibacteria bacterium]